MLRRFEKRGNFNSVFQGHFNDTYFRTGYLCYCLELSLGARIKVNFITDFPELWEGRPKEHVRQSNAWWNADEEGYLQRVSLLLEAIKKTEP